MATPQGEALTQAHRDAQAEITFATYAAMLRLWPALGDGRDESTTARWLTLVLAVIRAQRTKSATLAGAYLTAYQRVELGPLAVPYVPRPAVAINDQAVITSMMVTGPQRIRGELEKRARVHAKSRDGEPVDLPARGIVIPALRMREIATSSAGAAVRHVRDGARDTTSDVIRNDKRVIGYTRVTDGDPCYWCAILASRGPVYQKDSFDESNDRFFGPGNARAHDNCGCDLRPLYSRTGEDTGEWKKYEGIWVQASTGRSGKKAIAKFRELYEAQRRTGI